MPDPGARNEAPPPGSPADRLRILVVGGSPADAERVREILEGSVTRRFELRQIPSQAVLESRPSDVDLIVLDLSGQSADAVGPAVGSVLDAWHLPLVVLSDVDEESAAVATLEAGASGFLVKDELCAQTLVATLVIALENHHTIRRLELSRERALHLATHDQRTNLENRFSFGLRLSQAMAFAHRKQRRMAVLFTELGGLKSVNQSLGHSVGDGLLRAAAERLAGCVRRSDSVASSDAEDPSTAISHLGGSEFTVLLIEISDGQDAARVAHRIIEALSQPFVVEGHEVFASASVGIAVFPSDGADAETLLRNASAAKVDAKSSGPGAFRFYASSMNVEAARRLQLAGQLHRALDRGELALHYQPVRDAMSGALIGAEALLRWSNPEFGPVAPVEFIPIAEETGLILSIGEWVLRSALEQCRSWQDAGFRPIRLAVNLSARQLEPGTLVETVARNLEETELSPGLLELEITETTLAEYDRGTVNTFSELHDMGVGLALDDFGTGYSALSHLSRFPIDRLKIDRSFVAHVASNPHDGTIASAVIAMAHGLDLGVVAEGVETPDQAAYLRERGCDEFQGYLFGRPVPPGEFARFLQLEKPK